MITPYLRILNKNSLFMTVLKHNRSQWHKFCNINIQVLSIQYTRQQQKL